MCQLFDEKLAIAKFAYFTSRLFTVLLQGSPFGKRSFFVNTVAAVTIPAELAILDLFVLFKDKSLAAIALLCLDLVLTGLSHGEDRVTFVEGHLKASIADLHCLKVWLDGLESLVKLA